MSLGTSNRDGGKTSESGHLRALYKGILGEVLSGLAVSQRGAGANMSVDIAIGDAILPRSDATYGHPVFNDATLNQAITTADPTNPRRDIVIMYLDYNVTPSTGVSNNTNGVVLTKVVAGTPAGSPADPSDAALQAAAGSGNPYIKLARVRVAAAASSISNSVIDDFRSFTEDYGGGWKPQSSAADAWTYVAWDSTNKLATINVPDSSIMDLGMRIRYWQTTGSWKFGILVKIVSATQIIVYHGTDYSIINERMYNPVFSRDKAPSGFPLDPIKWSVKVTDTSNRAQASPVTNTWYNSGSISIGIPIGVWNVYVSANAQAGKAASQIDTHLALSTANNSASDSEMLTVSTARGDNTVGVNVSFNKDLTLTSTTTYFLNHRTTTAAMTTINIRGDLATTVIRARCAYL